MNLTIGPLSNEQIAEIAEAFAKLGWNKPDSQYSRYFEEQSTGKRFVLVAALEGKFAGYLTVILQSDYPPFKESGIPEIVDFNVLPQYRRQGIGSELMKSAEIIIRSYSPFAGIGVGMDSDYGAAQILYSKRGYLPDGNGIHYDNRKLKHGDVVTVDDSLCLHFTKKL